MMSALRSLVAALAAVVLAVVGSVHPSAQQKPTVQIPNPGVPEAMTVQANFVRAAWNNEAYVILGYQIANRTIGSNWIMLDVGMTLMEDVQAYELKRDALSLDTPDGTVPLPSIEEYRQANSETQPLQQRLKVQRDSINYFPPWVHGVNRLGMFSDLDSRAMPWDQVEVSNDRACMGQLYFKVPGGTKYGQYFLNVKFAKSVIRVPFRLFTKEEEKVVSKNYGSIKKQIDAAFTKKK